MSTTTPAPTLARPSVRRRLAARLYGHRLTQLLLLLAPPSAWFVLVYLGSLAFLFLAAFWYLDPATSAVVHQLSLTNFIKLLTEGVYRAVTLRTVGIAALVTFTDIAIAFPISFYMARVARPRLRSLLFMSVMLPLWSSYLVRVYAWRVILAPTGLFDWAAGSVGFPNLSPGFSDVSMYIVFCYLWLPYMILPIFTGLERIPESYFEASADLGARGATTFRRIILPLALPAVAAGSIFTFSLTLGDYITPSLVSNSQFIGNVIYESQGVANNVPFAAAYAIVPVAIMGAYLLIVRRLGAFEAL